MRMPGWFRKAAALSSPPFTPSDSWAGRLFGRGGMSEAGKAVTLDTALSLSVVWGCVRLISRTISTLPLQVYTVNGANTKELLDATDPLALVLGYRPNADTSAVDFWEGMVAALLFGNAYALKTRNSQGDIIALTQLNSNRMVVRWLPDGTPEFRYNSASQSYVWGPDDVLHLKGFTLDGRMGVSTLAYARNSMGAALAADEASGKMFANGMSLGGAISTDKTVQQDQRDRIKASMADYRGSPNTGKVLVLEGGFTWNTITMSADDAQLLETRQWQVEDICRWFDTAPEMIGHNGTSSGKGQTLEQRQLMFWQHTLSPWCRKIEQAIWYSMVPPAKRATTKIKFDISELLRSDSAGRAALYTAFAQNGIADRNTIRGWEDLPPDSDPNAGKLTVQSNLVILGDLGKEPPAQTPAGFGLPPSPNAPTKPGLPDPPVKQ